MRLAVADLRSLVAEHVPFFGQLTAPGQRRLVAACEARGVGRRTLILAEGEECPALLFVVRGSLRVFKSSDGGREITLYRVRPGDLCVLGMSCALSGTPYPAHLDAPEAVELIALPAPAFRALFEDEPSLRRAWSGESSGLVAGLMTLVAELAFRRMDQRLAAHLLAESARGDGKIAGSHEQLAAELGTAREVVSRLLDNFREEGWIDTERRSITVRSRAGLASLAER